MNVIKIILTGCGIAIVFYILGVLFPINQLQFNIDPEKTISSGEAFYYLICVFQTLGTIGAVIVALFSENIKNFLRKPQLNAKLHKEHVCEDLISLPNSDKKAKRYYNLIDIYNEGNTIANDCEIIIESISFSSGLDPKSSVDLIHKEIVVKWITDEEIRSTYIPVLGKKSFMLYEIFPPDEQSTPDGKKQTKPSYLKIGNYKVSEEYKGGSWTVNYCLQSTSLNHPHKFSVKIVWDGGWENREKEMKNKVSSYINVND